MDMQYQLKAGNYYLYDMRDQPSAVTGERRFKLKTDTVAIAFDAHTGEVHQHGSPTRIQSWANNTRRRLRAAAACVPPVPSRKPMTSWSCPARCPWMNSTNACG